MSIVYKEMHYTLPELTDADVHVGSDGLAFAVDYLLREVWRASKARCDVGEINDRDIFSQI